MKSADRLVSEDTELGREKDHIRKTLTVNGYPDWMLADSWMSDQWDPGQEEEKEVKEGEDEEKELEQRVPATTMAPQVPVTKKKYPAVLPYVRGILEQLRVFRYRHTLSRLTFSGNYCYGPRIR